MTAVRPLYYAIHPSPPVGPPCQLLVFLMPVSNCLIHQTGQQRIRTPSHSGLAVDCSCLARYYGAPTPSLGAPLCRCCRQHVILCRLDCDIPSLLVAHCPLSRTSSRCVDRSLRVLLGGHSQWTLHFSYWRLAQEIRYIALPSVGFTQLADH